MDLGEFMTFDFITYKHYIMCTHTHTRTHIYIFARYCVSRVYTVIRVCEYIKTNPPPAGTDFRSSGIADARSTLMCFPVYTLYILYGTPVNWTTPRPTPKIKYTEYVMHAVLYSIRATLSTGNWIYTFSHSPDLRCHKGLKKLSDDTASTHRK